MFFCCLCLNLAHAPIILDMHNKMGSHRMALLFVSAMNTVPRGPAQSPPGSDTRAFPPVPSVRPAAPLPATVRMLSVAGSSSCATTKSLLKCYNLMLAIGA